MAFRLDAVVAGEPRQELENFRGPVLSEGARFGAYEIVRLLGRGGMGAVYEARHVSLDKRVAIKLLHPDPLASDDHTARFLREGQAASQIRHPHVVDVTDNGSEQGLVYLVMEFLEGEDFHHYQDRVGPLELTDALDILIPIISGVAAAHDAGIVHRDLKPANVFLAQQKNRSHVPKVLDFGVAKTTRRTDASLTQTSLVLGTPQYLSPEQAKNSKAVDHRSDQYTLGLILYETLTGTQPFRGESLLETLSAIVQGDFAPPRKIRPDIPPEVERAILHAMRFEPKLRFPTVRHFGRELLPFASAKTRAIFEDEFSSLEDFASEPPEASADTRQKSASDSRTLRGSIVSVTPDEGTTVLHTDDERSKLPGPLPLLRSRVSSLWWAAVLVPVLVVIFLLGQNGARESINVPVAAAPPESPPAFEVKVESVPANASIEVDDREVGRGSVRLELPHDGTAHVLRVSAEGFVAQTHSFTDHAPPRRITLEPIPVSPTAREVERASTDPAIDVEPEPSPVRSVGQVRRQSLSRSGVQSPEASRDRSPSSMVVRRANGAPLLD